MDMDKDTDSRRPGTCPAPTTVSRHRFTAAVSRRRFLQVGGVLAGAAAVGAGASQLVGLTGRSRAGGGDGDDRGPQARGDPHAGEPVLRPLLRHPAGRPGLLRQAGAQVPERHDDLRAARQVSAPTSGYLLPFHMDSTKVDAQNAGDLDHSWSGDHSARNGGLWNNWVPAKTEQTMGYFTRSDLPFNYALADAFTICDGYHQSILGPTSPNRMYLWAGTSSGWTSNPPDYTVEFTNVTTYPELLLQARASPGRCTPTTRWATAAANDGWVGDYGDNPLWFYQQYQTSEEGDHDGGPAARRPGRGAAVAAERGHAARAEPRQPRARPVHRRLRRGHDSAGVLDRRAVRVLRAPGGEPELRRALRADGARVADGQPGAVGDAPRCSSPTTSTTATSTTCCRRPRRRRVTNEFIGGLPIGFGTRVPMIICSPWTRGGFVDSNTYDHTSMLRFLETWTGVPAPNITAWRRSVTGDLTAAFDFTSPDFSDPGAAGHGAADHPVRRGEVLPRRRAARRGRAGGSGAGDGHPAAPAEPATCRTPTSP